MLIIIDKNIPEEAKRNLQHYGELVLLETNSITEPSISGHPDIFFCKTGKGLITAKNLPEKLKNILKQQNISFTEGASDVLAVYPDAAHYNAVITKTHLIHRSDITDKEILNDCSELKKIHVSQGYTRCSMLSLDENNFITSDEGIYKTLISLRFECLLVSAKDIILPGQRYGFIGGACGILEDRLFVIGNLKHHKDGEIIRKFAGLQGYSIIELYDGPLFDGGSIIFIQP
jgi:hypothetical protein